MCDFSGQTKSRCFPAAGYSHRCSSGKECVGFSRGGFVPHLCEMHTEICSHCGKPFCPDCIEDHLKACSMRQDEPGLWERWFGDMST
jgi:hypothetical protein